MMIRKIAERVAQSHISDKISWEFYIFLIVPYSDHEALIYPGLLGFQPFLHGGIRCVKLSAII